MLACYLTVEFLRFVTDFVIIYPIRHKCIHISVLQIGKHRHQQALVSLQFTYVDRKSKNSDFYSAQVILMFPNIR